MGSHWQGSNRRSELPSDWSSRRQAVLARDGYQCTWIESTSQRCTEKATDVDHIIPGGSHEPANLRALCSWHHSRKSSAEGNAARLRLSMKRPKPRHPGLI
ncbi:HNH endonuclease [Kitasatospora acidiphila]|uniref:HNH endonuclease n=1 Tax=Kitasatospora acidiphila TaxID=2567942 RepID=A0A540W4G3_9ACTN|nr:HNH endonuclease [Kitasatospora acidiphila]